MVHFDGFDAVSGDSDASEISGTVDDLFQLTRHRKAVVDYQDPLHLSILLLWSS
jgi:hypothetical protein